MLYIVGVEIVFTEARYQSYKDQDLLSPDPGKNRKISSLHEKRDPPGYLLFTGETHREDPSVGCI